MDGAISRSRIWTQTTPMLENILLPGYLSLRTSWVINNTNRGNCLFPEGRAEGRAGGSLVVMYWRPSAWVRCSSLHRRAGWGAFLSVSLSCSQTCLPCKYFLWNMWVLDSVRPFRQTARLVIWWQHWILFQLPRAHSPVPSTTVETCQYAF